LDQELAEWLRVHVKSVLTADQYREVGAIFGDEQLEVSHLRFLNEERLKKMGLPYGIVFKLMPLLPGSQ
jgi:hypothetical protein